MLLIFFCVFYGAQSVEFILKGYPCVFPLALSYYCKAFPTILDFNVCFVYVMTYLAILRIFGGGLLDGMDMSAIIYYSYIFLIICFILIDYHILP